MKGYRLPVPSLNMFDNFMYHKDVNLSEQRCIFVVHVNKKIYRDTRRVVFDLCLLHIPFFMTAINGRMFGNLEGLEMCQGDEVAWHIIGFGGWFDMHGVNFDGQTLDYLGTKVEGKEIIPGSAVTLLSTPDKVGQWLVCQCQSRVYWELVILTM